MVPIQGRGAHLPLWTNQSLLISILIIHPSGFGGVLVGFLGLVGLGLVFFWGGGVHIYK